jgi:hypothetical protein
MLTDVGKLIHFGDAIRGEDLDWTIRMAKRGFLEREYRADPSRIHYLYNMGDRKVHSGTLDAQKHTTYETMLQMLWTPAGAQAPDLRSNGSRIPVLKLGPRGFVSS